MLDSVFAGLAGTNPDDLLEAGHEDLAVTDLAGVGRLADRFQGGLDTAFSNGNLNLYLVP